MVYEPSICHVYVRDRQSSNGTYVNGELVGVGPDMSSGYLLQQSDLIEIRPHWSFVFEQTHDTPCHELTTVQVKESDVSLSHSRLKRILINASGILSSLPVDQALPWRRC